MTQEEKQLLLKDLCARLPYGVIVSCAEGTVMGIHWNKVKLDASLLFELQDNDALSYVKPYLRPMSSMTEEEFEDFYDSSSEENDPFDVNISQVDWLNAHHFDYRDLIPKGLALEAPEGMYKTE